jgi:RNA recognition motif-containing protein
MRHLRRNTAPDSRLPVELYVGNLPWSITDEALTNLFAAHGAVSRAKVVMDRETGRSRGFGFVTMTNAPEGQAAIQALNGHDYEGRTLRVREAEPRQPGGGHGGGGHGGGGHGGGGGGYGGGGRPPRRENREGGYGGGNREGGYGGGNREGGYGGGNRH